MLGRAARTADGGLVRLGRVARRLLRVLPGPVVVVPREQARATLEGLEAVRAKERQMEAAVRDGAKAPSWLAGVLAGPGVSFVD